MKKFTILLSLLLVGCWGTKAPDRASSNLIANNVSTLRSDVQDRAAGTNAAIAYTAGKLPDSREKEVIKVFVDDQFRILGQPRLETQTSFEKAATELLSTNASDRAKGEALRAQLANENQALKEKLVQAETEFKAAREREQAEFKAELQKTREEAETSQRRLISYIFFGGGALLLGIGVVILLTASSVPMFGPKVGFGVIGAGGVAIFTGILVTQLMKQIDNHPWILWTGFGVIILFLTGAGALAYANHAHHKFLLQSQDK